MSVFGNEAPHSDGQGKKEHNPQTTELPQHISERYPYGTRVRGSDIQNERADYSVTETSDGRDLRKAADDYLNGETSNLIDSEDFALIGDLSKVEKISFTRIVLDKLLKRDKENGFAQVCYGLMDLCGSDAVLVALNDIEHGDDSEARALMNKGIEKEVEHYNQLLEGFTDIQYQDTDFYRFPVHKLLVLASVHYDASIALRER